MTLVSTAGVSVGVDLGAPVDGERVVGGVGEGCTAEEVSVGNGDC